MMLEHLKSTYPVSEYSGLTIINLTILESEFGATSILPIDTPESWNKGEYIGYALLSPRGKANAPNVLLLVNFN